MKGFSQSPKYRTRLLLSFVLVLLIPSVLLGTVFWYQSVSDVTSSAKRLYEDSLEQTVDLVEDAVYQAKRLATTLASSKWVRKIAFMQGSSIDYDRLDIYTLIEYCEGFAQASKTNSFSDQSMLFFFSKDLAVTTEGPMPIRSAMRRGFSVPAGEADPLLEKIRQNEDVCYFYPQDAPSNMLYIVKWLPIEHSRTDVQLVFPIKTSVLERILDSSIQNCATYLRIGDQMIHASGAWPALDAVMQGWTGESRITVEDEAYYVFSKVSSLNGWQYVRCVPRSIILAGVTRVKNTMLILCAAIGVMGVAVVFWLTRRTYQPLRQLSSAVLPKDEFVGNELDAIQRVFQQLAEREKDMNRQLTLYTPLAQEAFFLRVLSGAIPEPEIAELARSLKLSLQEGKWVVALAPLYGPPVAASGKAQAYFVRFGPERIVAIVSAETEEKAYGQMQNVLGLLHGAVGVSSVHGSLSELADAYIEACIALEFASEAHPAYYAGLQAQRFNYDYSQEDEHAFVNCLHAGMTEKALELVDTLRKRNCENGHFAMRCLYYHLIAVLLGVCRTERLPSLENDDCITLLASGELSGYLEAMIRCVCENEKKNLGSGRGIGGAMVAFVREHCLEPGMSLVFVAERFNVTAQHISRLYKERTGITFLEGVARMRIDEAKRLLLTDGNTVEQIAAQVGFENVMAFRRTFKKMEGITPSEFRQMRKNEP